MIMNQKINYSLLMITIIMLVGTIAEGSYHLSGWSQEGRAFTAFLILFEVL